MSKGSFLFILLNISQFSSSVRFFGTFKIYSLNELKPPQQLFSFKPLSSLSPTIIEKWRPRFSYTMISGCCTRQAHWLSCCVCSQGLLQGDSPALGRSKHCIFLEFSESVFYVMPFLLSMDSPNPHIASFVSKMFLNFSFLF